MATTNPANYPPSVGNCLTGTQSTIIGPINSCLDDCTNTLIDAKDAIIDQLANALATCQQTVSTLSNSVFASADSILTRTETVVNSLISSIDDMLVNEFANVYSITIPLGITVNSPDVNVFNQNVTTIDAIIQPRPGSIIVNVEEPSGTVGDGTIPVNTKLVGETDFPVDLDQPHAFLFSGDDNKWRAKFNRFYENALDEWGENAVMSELNDHFMETLIVEEKEL